MVSVLVKTFLVQAFVIPSGSMEPTLHGCQGCVGDRVLVEKLGDVGRGDVVVFHDPGGWLGATDPDARGPAGLADALAFVGVTAADPGTHLVKRVIGVGGDTVEARGGTVHVNGRPLAEPYLAPGEAGSLLEFSVRVPSGHLWVMGDNRSRSSDSRAHRDAPDRGFVPLEDVVGRAFVTIYPVSRVRTHPVPAPFADVPAAASPATRAVVTG